MAASATTLCDDIKASLDGMVEKPESRIRYVTAHEKARKIISVEFPVDTAQEKTFMWIMKPTQTKSFIKRLESWIEKVTMDDRFYFIVCSLVVRLAQDTRIGVALRLHILTKPTTKASSVVERQ